jgi:xanthine/CO dehydrogenase XdhC/CoxF family maturation factor
MTDLERILALWRTLEIDGTEFVLATVTGVEGPGYRKPGALMLISADGRRAGAISGGCLEAEVAKRAFWLTAQGPCIERYSTADDDGDRPFGSGCGGAVLLLLERKATSTRLLHALDSAYEHRVPLAVATVVSEPALAARAIAGLDGAEWPQDRVTQSVTNLGEVDLMAMAEAALASGTSSRTSAPAGSAEPAVWVDYRPSRPGIWIYGAGDDARPLVKLAKDLGWFVGLADGRSHLATRERFPEADEVTVLSIRDLPKNRDSTRSATSALGAFHKRDAAIVMTHSFEQDSRILAALLSRRVALGYIGVLGPQRRTRELLAEAATLLGVEDNAAQEQVERWLETLHAPTGLDLGAESPEAIALSILAEIQKTLTSSTARPLHEVRAAR